MNFEFGLTNEVAAKKLTQDGFNEIATEKRRSIGLLFLLQFKSPLVLVLIFACVVSLFIGEKLDAIAIAVILIVNAIIGFFLENKAETSINALQRLTAPRAKVLRSGEQKNILAREVVNGDVLLIEEGDLVAADSQVLKAARLLANESILTGESIPVEKMESDILFMGTTVVAGTATALVTATGMQTELGHIAHLLRTSSSGPTPLQVQLTKVGNVLLIICLIFVSVIMMVGLSEGRSWVELFVFSMSLAVAAVPEGLPAIVTIALALGVQRLTARNAYIRSMPSVETLGSVSVICTDKTGTLTTGVMRVREIWGEDSAFTLTAAASCVDAEIGRDGSGTGDPTEVAILLSAFERHIEKNEIERNNPRISSEPFDSKRRLMSIYRNDKVNYVKGAVENVLSLCLCDEAKRLSVLKATDEMTSRGLRVLAIATGRFPEERDLSFVGLLGIADPPRTEVIEALKEARSAGITTVMITGDHPLTAAAIAREIGLVLEGEQVESRVHARATPEEKLELVRKWKSQGAIVAMTGDGVNDAPALKEAHVGVAMGRAGSEVTRQSADMVLADDNYATIIAAVREGRHIFKNIRRAITYLLTGNFAEVLVVLAAMVFGLPVPLSAAHLLWINLVTDSLPALTLMAEPISPNIMKVAPRAITEKILGRAEWKRIIWLGILEGFVVFVLFIYSLRTSSIGMAQGIAFSTLVFSQLFRSFGSRSETRIFLKVGLFSNLWLLGVVGLTSILQISLHFMPVTQRVFNLEPLGSKALLLMLLVSLIPVTVIEIKKLIGTKVGRSKEPTEEVLV